MGNSAVWIRVFIISVIRCFTEAYSAREVSCKASTLSIRVRTRCYNFKYIHFFCVDHVCLNKYQMVCVLFQEQSLYLDQTGGYVVIIPLAYGHRGDVQQHKMYLFMSLHIHLQ